MPPTSDTIPSPFTAARQMRRVNLRPSLPSFFVVMIDYGRKGCEAIVDPEVTRREVISRIVSGEYRNIRFIQEVRDGIATDVTLEMQIAASAVAVGNHVREAFSIFNEWCDAIGQETSEQDVAADVVRAS